jgi:XRE family aerobic/anaerobic benzoate catabolism transcriptional regulator
VWLKAKPEDHWKRVLGQGDTRPMANRASAMTELRSILSLRSPLYSEAAQTVDTSSVRVSTAVKAIATALESRDGKIDEKVADSRAKHALHRYKRIKKN